MPRMCCESKGKRYVHAVLHELAETLNAAIGDDDDRTDIIESMASAAGIEASTVNQILRLTVRHCLDLRALPVRLICL